jgi:hypothetical protein
MPGDVGAVAKLADTLASWFLSPEGYTKWALDRKLAALHEEYKDALRKKDAARVDAVLAELARLRDVHT